MVANDPHRQRTGRPQGAPPARPMPPVAQAPVRMQPQPPLTPTRGTSAPAAIPTVPAAIPTASTGRPHPSAAATPLPKTPVSAPAQSAPVQPAAPARVPTHRSGRSRQSAESDAATRPKPLVVTVVCGKRSARLRIPSSRPLVDLLPDIAKKLGVLDPTLVYAGYRLVRDDGTELADSTTLRDQQVTDGERLTLVVNALDDADIVYDDIVEAVGRSVEHAHRPWTRENTTLTALVISCGILTASALCLLLTGVSVLNVSVAAVAAAALLGIATMLNAKSLDDQAVAVTMCAGLFAAVAGFHLMSILRPGPVMQFPSIGAGIGLLLIAGGAALAVSHRRLFMVIPAVVGGVLAVVGLLCALTPDWTGRIWTITVAVVGLAATALPWLSLSLSRLSVDSPTSESEIFALPKPIDIGEVRRRYRHGSTLLFDLRAAAACVLVIGVSVVVSVPSPAGFALIMAILIGMLLDARRIYAQSEMIVTVVAAGVGLVMATLTGSQTHPQWMPIITSLFVVAALICTVGTQISQRDSILMTRLADAADVICTVAIPPLAYLALGL